jgi:peptide/nickel transport system substrate-binding protein
MESEVGITVTLDPIDPSSQYARYFSGQYSAVAQVIGGQVDPSMTIGFNYLGGFSLVKGTPQEAEVTDLAQKALNPTLSEAERAKLYEQVWRIINQNVLDVPICAQGNMWVHTAKVLNGTNIPYTFGGYIDPRYLAISK